MIIILIVALFSLLILVHEYGHFIAARRSGVFVEEFGLGFPPRLFCLWRDKTQGKWRLSFLRDGRIPDTKKRGTIFSLNVIPFGGFVKLKGEDGERRDEPDSYAAQSVWKRMIIVVAGVVMNIILAFVLLSILHGIGVPTVVDAQDGKGGVVKEQRVIIVDVVEGSPAAEAGIEPNDILLGLTAAEESLQPIREAAMVSDFINNHRGELLSISLKRGKEEITFTAVPRQETTPEEGALGIAMLTIGDVRFPWYRAIWEGVKATVGMIGLIVGAFGTVLRDLFSQGQLTQDLAGPVGIVVLSSQIAKLGFNHFLQFGAIISINLAIINIFPFPALDGGRIVFLGLEVLRGKPVRPRVEQMVHNIGFVLLLALIFLVTIRDVGRYF